MKLIEDWLKGGQNYSVGVRIYLQHGHDKNLLRLLTSEGETPFKKQKLVAALRALVQPSAPIGAGQPAKATQPQADEPTTQEVFLKQWPASRNKDAVLQSLWEKARLLLKEIAAIHSTLPLLDPPKRLAAALSLLRKDDELDELYQQRDHYEAKGKLPDQPEAQPLLEDPFLMGNRLANLKRYIRREKQAVANDPENAGAKMRLHTYVAEYNQYMRKLGKAEVTC